MEKGRSEKHFEQWLEEAQARIPVGLKMSAEMKSELKSLFIKTDPLWPVSKQAQMNYDYLCNKFCDYLGKTEYLVFFPVFTSKFKREQCDRIWEPIRVSFSQ